MAKISLRSRGQKLLFLLITAVPASLFAVQTVRIVLAQIWGESQDVKTVQRAIAMDPRNPEFRYRLGTLYLFSSKGDPAEAVSSLRKAVELNPNQAKYWLGLGHGCLVTGDELCAEGAFERAVELAPMKPEMEWEAASYYSTQLSVLSTQSPEQSAIASQQPPENAPGQDASSNYKLQISNYKLFGHLRRLLELSPESASQVFQLTWRAFDDPTLVWQNLVSQSRNEAVKCAYLDFLAEKNQFDLTGEYWKSVVSRQSSVVSQQSPAQPSVGGRKLSIISRQSSDRTSECSAAVLGGGPSPRESAGSLATEIQFDSVKPYLQRLLYTGHYEEAVTVWDDLLRLGIVKSSASDVAPASTPSLPDAAPSSLPTAESQEPTANLVFNANFMNPILNAGFDWRLNQQEYVTLDFVQGEGFSQGNSLQPTANGGVPAESREPRAESRILRIDFTFPHNAEDEPIYQFVPVVPGQTYKLEAYVRSEGITSDSGPRLRVIDPQCPQCLDVATDGVTGTTPWHEVSVQFTAGATPVVRISVWRSRSRTFPMDISGRAWFADIILRQVQSAVASKLSN